MSSTAVTRCLAAAARYRDTRTACEKIDAGDFNSITDDDLRQVVFLTPAEWRRREQYAMAVLAEREHATIH